MSSFKLFVASAVLAVVLAPAMMGCKPPADPIPAENPSGETDTTDEDADHDHDHADGEDHDHEEAGSNTTN